DLSEVAEDERQNAVLELAHEEARHSFDLTRGPLIKAHLLRLQAEEHVILLTMHHIVSDGWSIGVFVREMAALYESYSHARPSPLGDLPVQYADYARWQRIWLQPEALQDQLTYWKQQLAGELPILQLPTDRPRPAVQTHHGARHYVAVPESQSAALEELSQREGVTLFMILLAAFQVLLFRYTRQTDISVGSSIAGRNRAEVESLIGFFLNTLVLRTDLSGNPTFLELLERVREVSLGAYAHQDVPIEMLLETLHPERGLSSNPLFQVLLIFQNTPMPALSLSNLTLIPMEIDTHTAKFELTLDLTRKPEGIVGWFEYNTDLFDATTIARLDAHFQTLLESIIANPQQRIGDLSLLIEPEQHQLRAWSEREVEAPVNRKCVHQMFEEQVERTPEAEAVVLGAQSLTYRELNQRANQVAHYLRRHAVAAEKLVGICMDRSVDMIVSLLGILKAGGAYVPLDPGYPRDRLAYMIEDAGISILLTQQSLSGRLTPNVAHTVLLDADREAIERESTQNGESGVSDQNLAYVLYTSGSTGKPKAVQIQHQSLANYTETAIAEFELEAADRVLQFASISFDTSAEEIYPCLSSGAALVLRTDAMLGSAATFAQRCHDWGITVLDLPTAYWHEIMNDLDAMAGRFPASLRLVIIGGEKALPERVAGWRKHFAGGRPRLVNTYGPTETTIVATMCDLAGDGSPDEARPAAPIGHPIRHARVYVLDQSLQQVPVGVYGEVCIGGVGVARGYLNQPALTAERFVPIPFGDEPGARLYKTGDLARWLPEGILEYSGRLDHQVKIRGFRVELGEIEAALGQHPAIGETVVVARDEQDDKRIVAYLTTKEQDAPATAALRSFLREKLPEHMIPSAFVRLEALPLTVNGKIDVRALPAPERNRPDQEATFVAPRNPIEEMVAGIWTELLGLEEVGVEDNFFDVGGHSLLATQLISRIRESLHVDVPLRDIFESSTVAALSEKIDLAIRTSQNVTLPPIVPIPRDQDLPLSFPQERLWLLHQLHPESVAYHVMRPMRVTGALDVQLLQRALTEVLNRHEVYRTTIG
ncbi:MAG TPA: amino acid adenylation domain-containing protein, partial [Pyrinomonadaceae bacterium]|nr:amino acid adenylation domain-containing protein [Pyrinomonadaceae bacterium]